MQICLIIASLALTAIVPAVSGMEQNVSVKFDMLYVSDFSFNGDNFVPDGGWEQYEGRTDSATLHGTAVKEEVRLNLVNTHNVSDEEQRDCYVLYTKDGRNLSALHQVGTSSGLAGQDFAWDFPGALIDQYGSGIIVKVYSRRYLGMTGHEDGAPFSYQRRTFDPDGMEVIYCSGRGPYVLEGEWQIPSDMKNRYETQTRNYDLRVRNYGI